MSTFKYYKNGQWNYVNGAITGDTLPIGGITLFAGATAPTGWLICDGSYVSKTTYAELYSVIGDDFLDEGTAPTGTFRLPNYEGRIPVGVDPDDTDFNTIGKSGGEKAHTLTTNEMPSHDHEMWADANETLQDQYGVSTNTILYNHKRVSWAKTASTGGGQAHNNVQPFQTINYIIKANQSAGVVANVSDTYSTSETDTYSCDYGNKHFGGVELYSGTTAGNVTLSESAANYSAIEIFYKSSDSVYLNTGKIYSPNGKNVGLYAPYSIGTTCYSKLAQVSISGTSLTMSNEIETQLWASNEKVAINTPAGGNHYFTIEKVIGYK